MLTVKVTMKLDRSPVKRMPVALRLDAADQATPPVLTDRSGCAHFDLPPASGTVLVDGRERYQGPLVGEIPIELWSITQSSDDAQGAAGRLPVGSNAYPGMQRRRLRVDGREVETDSEGYLVNPADWSESFVRAQAAAEGLPLTDAHWDVVRYLRAHFTRTGTQASVREMIKHFRRVWTAGAGESASLHRLFPRGGPQKQGNRLAGLLRTKGEH
ncbi:TusE/DsrC/DsvC family sulfur relay protein [uncultured Thiodictyon sp.]|uniref:TusE/DsrC/DsvC family sulfur relay protein n=1 Tax=uncultured Thiodictyon sp. TaxID=1846217 RepID=UPI0025E7FE16|nr:TusE/DsrC/DsvC family sulfur relay protein [uncultured Thiodictyon sp.]